MYTQTKLKIFFSIVVVNFFVAFNSLAWTDDYNSSNDNFQKMQEFIHDRDVLRNERQIPHTPPVKPNRQRDIINNLRQIPREDSFDEFKKGGNKNCKTHCFSRRTHSTSPFLNRYLQDYSSDNYNNYYDYWPY